MNSECCFLLENCWRVWNTRTPQPMSMSGFETYSHYSAAFYFSSSYFRWVVEIFIKIFNSTKFNHLAVQTSLLCMKSQLKTLPTPYLSHHLSSHFSEAWMWPPHREGFPGPCAPLVPAPLHLPLAATQAATVEPVEVQPDPPAPGGSVLAPSPASPSLP